MSRMGIPVTVVPIEGNGLRLHSVSTLCGQSWPGMTLSDDLGIQVLRALDHVAECERCQSRWAVLCTPGATLVSTGGQGYTPGATLVSTGPTPASDAMRGDESYAHEDSCRCYDCRPWLHED